MARTSAQLDGWAQLLELCRDDCQVFDTTKAMRQAVIEIERELSRLHKIEEESIQMARESFIYSKSLSEMDASDEADWAAYEAFEAALFAFRSCLRSLIPEAFAGMSA